MKRPPSRHQGEAMLKSAILFSAAIAGLVCLSPAPAQDILENVVVTGIRAGIAEEAPVVTMIKRADYLITKVMVVCDTRDPAKRRAELRETLRSMIRTAARGKSISLSVGDTVIIDLTDTMLDKVIEPDVRSDTSRAQVVIKTVVLKDDSFDAATGRIERFIAETPKAGRSEILRDKQWNLTIVGPDQYRAALIAKIADEAKRTAALFGPNYGIRIEGLQRTVSWYQKGPLDLALYIPFNLTVVPSGQ